MTETSARLINTTAIESPSGLRSINLFHGDICSAEDELLVISSHAGEGDELTGMVVDALASGYAVDFSRMAAILKVEDIPSVGTFRVQVNPSSHRHPAKEILVVRIPGCAEAEYYYGKSAIDLYDEAVWTLFGTLAAWEQKGRFFQGLAMPLLGGLRGYPELAIMQVLLKRAANWLKTSQSMHAINLYLYDDAPLKVWSDAMDNVLGRRVIDSAKNDVVRALRDEILALIDRSKKFRQPPLEETVKPIKDALKGKQICLQLVSAFSRRLVESIVSAILAERRIESRGSLVQDIQTLGYRQVVAPWIISHFHALRVFGNETLHAKGQVSYRPDSLQEDDLVSVLTSLRSVVQFYGEW